MIQPEDVLSFWLGPPGEDIQVAIQRWFRKVPEIDRQIQERFGDVLIRAGNGECNDWAKTPRHRLALILLFDQIVRNIRRGTKEMFEFDERAQKLAVEGLHEGMDRDLSILERYFFSFPLQHSENEELQDWSLQLSQKLLDEGPPPLQFLLQKHHDHARLFRDVIHRFGRFPHRNGLLGRESTPEEIDFLKTPGLPF
ncbi:DUF924 family protein [Pendulispora albinea]|uniref:DUF924 domain-containing protein n=1 Tax=Pendulispora albinea TaxID=2741071 RepID=A0ABZ2LTA0_9BACT